ncbi:MAG TPA: hypothetical protein PL081_00280 [Pseudomonadales bacterium]|nr:hypothetical protein [Pseudomonadales bacterium]
MSTLQEDLKQLAAQLKVERDALHLQAHLLKLDLLDEWQKSEKKWEQLNQKLQRAGTEGVASGQEIGAAVKLLGEELKSAYQRINRQLKG